MCCFVLLRVQVCTSTFRHELTHQLATSTDLTPQVLQKPTNQPTNRTTATHFLHLAQVVPAGLAQATPPFRLRSPSVPGPVCHVTRQPATTGSQLNTTHPEVSSETPRCACVCVCDEASALCSGAVGTPTQETDAIDDGYRGS